MFTSNALDLVDDLAAMSAELLRVIKPGGLLIGSFNLNEPPSEKEPQRLDEELVQTALLAGVGVDSYRIRPVGPEGRYQ